MIDEKKDYRTRDEKLDEFQHAVIESHVEMSAAIVELQEQVQSILRMLAERDDVRG